MILNKNTWVKEDKDEFLNYLKTLGNPEKTDWSKNILQTASSVLAIPTKEMVRVANEIMKGNFHSFLDLQITDYYETIALYGILISRMKDYDDFIHYLQFYLDYMNCWAHCDLLKFPFLYEHSQDYLALSKQYRSDERVMVRRLSLNILFQYVKDKNYLPLILESLLDFEHEDEYYVIMMGGWLLSECIILYRDETLAFLDNHTINKKIQNKAIQKCRESNRLSREEKDFLLKYKVK